MFHGKPIVGIAGGIGSGKSFVARCFERFGWIVIDSDAAARAVYDEPAIQRTLKDWWGDAVTSADGRVDRSLVARIIFGNKSERLRLEALIHPAVADLRDFRMLSVADDPAVCGFIWDSPLLFESGLNEQCDSIVFVDAPEELRTARVTQRRGWSREELVRREISQLPLDTKRKMSQDVIRNTSDQTDVCGQVEGVLARISERLKVRTIRAAAKFESNPS